MASLVTQHDCGWHGRDADVTGLFINMEHSYLGDLTVTYICPNGQSVQVQDQSGFSTFLGEPVDSDDTPNAGSGIRLCGLR